MDLLKELHSAARPSERSEARQVQLAHHPDRFLGGALGSSTQLVGSCTRSADLACSDTAFRVRADARQHRALTVVACNNVLRSLLESGYFEEGPVFRA